MKTAGLASPWQPSRRRVHPVGDLLAICCRAQADALAAHTVEAADVVAELEAAMNERCCHLLPHALAAATVTSPYRKTGLCGYRPHLPAHDCGDPLALTCPGCGRPRCPECAIRYQRTRR